MIRHIFDSEEQLADSVGKTIRNLMEDAVCKQTKFSIGLSGGSMPNLLSPVLRQFSFAHWSLIHFFYCDERLVSLTDPDSTHKAYQEELYSHIPIPRENVHVVDPSLSTQEAAKDYQKKILTFFGTSNGYPRFDLLLLGIGPDGHTCSLFPNHELLKCEDAVVAPIDDSPKPPPRRVTLTLPVLNKAKNVFFLVCGSNKADAVSKAFTTSSPSLPCSLVHPVDGTLCWYLDKAAASGL